MAHEKRAYCSALKRSSNRNHNDLWQNLLKKTSASANALPGTVTSTTAHGYLPQYSGHAAASLSPTIAATVSSTRVSPNKAQDIGGVELLSQQENRGENLPPAAAEEPMISPHKTNTRAHNQHGLATRSWNA